MEKQVRDASQVGTLRGQPWDSVQGCGSGKDSQRDMGRAVLLLHFGCWAAPLPSSPKQLLLKTQGALPRPQGAGTGRDSGSRAGCWRAGTHPSMWKAHWDGERREERPRREAKGWPLAHSSCITGNIWPGIWGCALDAHTCVHKCMGMGKHTHTYVFMGTCISVRVPMPVCMHVHVCPCAHTCTDTHTQA